MCAGVYVFDPKERKDSEVNHLLDYANIAQKKAKAVQGSQMMFFDTELWMHEMRTSKIRHGVNDALSNGEITPWFQPQYDYVTGQIIGAEVQGGTVLSLELYYRRNLYLYLKIQDRCFFWTILYGKKHVDICRNGRNPVRIYRYRFQLIYQEMIYCA